jgi:hypothetical protein
MVPDVPVDRAVAVRAADDPVRQVENCDEGFELPAIPFGVLAAADVGEL